MRRGLVLPVGAGLLLVTGLAVTFTPAGPGFAASCLCAVGLAGVVVTVLPELRGTTGGVAVRRWAPFLFVVHLLLGVVVVSRPALTTFFGGDAFTYHAEAVAVARHLAGGPAPALAPGKEGFPYVLGTLYALFGSHPVNGVALNAGLFVAAVALVTATTTLLFDEAAAGRIPMIMGVLPGFLLWTSQLLREAGVIFLVALAVYASVRMVTARAPAAAWLLGGAAAALVAFRANIGIVLTAGLLAGLFAGRRHEGPSGAGQGALAAGVVAVLVLGLGVGYSGYRLVSSADLHQVNAVRTDLAASAQSGVGAGVDVSTPRRAATFLPRGLAEFLLGPFPWQVGGGRQLYGLLDAAAVWLLIPATMRGWRRAHDADDRRVRILVLPAAMVAALLCLLIGNYGTIVRERIQVIVLLVPLMAAGWRFGQHGVAPEPVATSDER